MPALSVCALSHNEFVTPVCPICECTESSGHVFREMMFGTRDDFAYRECRHCGFLWIATVPERLERFYGKGYYSFSAPSRSPLRRWSYQLHYHAARRIPALRKPGGAAFGSVLRAGLGPGQRVLDVGCGSGRLVSILQGVGLQALGVDPFVEKPSALVRRQTVQETEPGWDLVMFHHSLEHMRDQVATLTAARRLLNPGGLCLVRMPVAAWAWKHYGAHWVQLDAPRHLALHTLQSFSVACERSGFRVHEVVFDSGAFQFTGSELRLRDIALSEAARHPFSAAERRRFRAEAAALNARQQGDQAAFYLRPA